MYIIYRYYILYIHVLVYKIIDSCLYVYMYLFTYKYYYM